MTVGAGFAQVPFVNVIATMAIHASRARVFAIDLLSRRVASNTGHLRVTTMEGKRREPIVIE